MEKTTGFWILGILVTIYAIINIVGLVAISVQEVKVTVNSSEIADEVATQVIAVLPEEPEENVSVIDSNYILNKGEYEDEVTEAKALEMALDELDSRDFKKAVFDLLTNETGLNTVEVVDIDSYKDITEFKVMDSDVDVDNDFNVTLDVKVYYFLDGDEDETERARLKKFIIVIEDLDFDEDFEDAEVSEDYLDTLEVKKVYS